MLELLMALAVGLLVGFFAGALTLTRLQRVWTERRAESRSALRAQILEENGGGPGATER